MTTSSQAKTFDLVVIGGGSAGYAAARTASDLGLKTAVIDGSETLGGLCILRGCMPSKTLIESSNRFRSIRRAKDFGLRAEQVAVIGTEIIERKRRLIGEFADYRQEQLTDGRFELIRGFAAFEDSHSLNVRLREGGEMRIEFATALISTGSVISKLSLPGLEEAGYWTSDDTLEAETVPDSIIVLGGGAIALEMACYFEGLGKEVTVIQRSPHLLTGTDHDIADALAEAIGSRENLGLFTGTRLERVEIGGDGKKTVYFDHRGEARQVSADQILQALGRRPATDNLNLEAAAIQLGENQRSLQVDSQQATTQAHIFAAGDVCGPHEVVHIAIEQGEAAAVNAARLLGKSNQEPKTVDYRLKLFGVFTDPQVATVGLSETDAAAENRPVVFASHPFNDHGKSMVMGETHGFVKLIADPENGELLGGAAVGPEAAELIHEISVALYFRCTASQFLEIPHYHPTLSEIWHYPAEEISKLQCV